MVRLARITVKGRVQGVAYRAATRNEAMRLGLNGSVRNLADGSVEALAGGEPANVEALIAWCQNGPPQARVESVSVEWLDGEMPESGFSIRY